MWARVHMVEAKSLSSTIIRATCSHVGKRWLMLDSNNTEQYDNILNRYIGTPSKLRRSTFTLTSPHFQHGAGTRWCLLLRQQLATTNVAPLAGRSRRSVERASRELNSTDIFAHNTSGCAPHPRSHFAPFVVFANLTVARG